MLQILRRFGSVAHESGGFKCPRCWGTKIRFLEQIGNVDLYQCMTELTPLMGGKSRPCTQKFMYQTKAGEQIAPEDLKSRPELAFSTLLSEGRKFLPRLSAAQARSLPFLKSRTKNEA